MLYSIYLTALTFFLFVNVVRFFYGYIINLFFFLQNMWLLKVMAFKCKLQLHTSMKIILTASCVLYFIVKFLFSLKLHRTLSTCWLSPKKVSAALLLLIHKDFKVIG